MLQICVSSVQEGSLMMSYIMYGSLDSSKHSSLLLCLGIIKGCCVPSQNFSGLMKQITDHCIATCLKSVKCFLNKDWIRPIENIKCWKEHSVILQTLHSVVFLPWPHSLSNQKLQVSLVCSVSFLLSNNTPATSKSSLLLRHSLLSLTGSALFECGVVQMELGVLKISELPVEIYGVCMSMLGLHISLWGLKSRMPGGGCLMLSQGLSPIRAIYLSEAKGVFQRVSNVYPNPRRFFSLIGNFSFAHNFHKNVHLMARYEQPENESPS